VLERRDGLVVNMEIGSFLELAFQRGLEYYTSISVAHNNSIARLNSGRAAIYHATRVLHCDTVYLPYYQCETVRIFLIKKGIKVLYYSIDIEFESQINPCTRNTAIVLVNYFGIMSYARMSQLAARYQNVIIDHSQAFFAQPIANCMNVYSVRKFIGTADGAYVIGNHANQYLEEYEQDYSSDTSLFLLQRIEYGCEGKAYQTRKANEDRINDSEIKKMSTLTHTILDGTDYDFIKKKRKENFDIASALFDSINKINPQIYYSEDCVPMVYPLVIEVEGLLERLIEHKIFQGHWWSYVLSEVAPDSFEYSLSSYLIPITIDQRYGEEEIKYIYNIINDMI